MRKVLAASLAAASIGVTAVVFAQQPPMPHPVAQPVNPVHGPQDSLPPNGQIRPTQLPHPPGQMPGHGFPSGGRPLMPGMHPPAAAAGEHDEGGGEHEHAPQPFNFMYGLLGEKAGVEPSIAWRTPGMPVPFLANLINLGILAYIIARFGKKPLVDGLAKRKTDLMHDIDEAAKVKAEATARLGEYKAKIDKLDDDLAQIRSDFSEQAKRDEERILREAKEKRERMKRDAEFLLEQETKAKRSELIEGAVAKASAAAEALVKQRMTSSDQERLAEEYLSQVGMATKASARGVA